MRSATITLVLLAACSQSHEDPNDDQPANWPMFCRTTTIAYCESGVDERPPDVCEEEDLTDFCADDVDWPCLPIPTRAQARECVMTLTDFWNSSDYDPADFPAECDYWACLFDE